MNDKDNTLQTSDELQPDETQQEQSSMTTTPQEQPDEVTAILERLGVSESTATSARTIIDSIEAGKPPSENFVKLIVNALNHDEDMKNAEAAGYLRGRNETIEAASNLQDEQTPKPVNFPIYRKRSFWD